MGACAPTASVQKLPNIVDSEIISDSTAVNSEDPLLADIAEMSDRQKLVNANNFSIAGDIEASNRFLHHINTQNLSNQKFIDYILLATENYRALFQTQQAAKLVNHPRLKSMFNRQNKEIKQRILNLRADIAFANGSYYQGLDELIKLARLSKRKTQTREIHDRIWSITSRMPFQQLDKERLRAMLYQAG